ncbi:MAG: oligosaccharide flippase family protein [Planctomycetota bacterium]
MSEPSLTHRTSAGAGWLTAGSLLGKVFGLASQIVLGAILIEEQYGAWAAIFGFNVIASAVRDLVIVELMIRGGREELSENFGPVIWMGGGMSLLTALAMFAMGYVFADQFDNPDFAKLNTFFAGLHVLSFPTVLTRGLLAIDLRFRRIGMMNVAGSFGRSTAGIIAASLGAGVYSFIFAFYAEYVAVLIAGVRRLGLKDLSLRPNFRRWPRLLKDLPGLLVSRVGITLTNGGDLLLLGAMSTQAVAGVYLFAVQLVNQFAVVLGQGVQGVLLPGFSRLRHDPPRLRAALGRALDAQALLAGLGCGGLMACIDSAMNFVWLDKWEAATVPAQIFVAGLSVRLAAATAIPALRAEGRFITDGALAIAQGLSLPLGIYIALQSGAGVVGITATGASLLAIVQLVLVAAPFIGGAAGEPARAVGVVLARLIPPLLVGALIAFAASSIKLTGILPEGRLGYGIVLFGKALTYAVVAWLMVLTVFRGATRSALDAMPPKLTKHIHLIPGATRLTRKP